jgi:hypothetical protein
LPNLQNEIITIYVKVGASSWKTLATTKTDSNGRFMWVLNVNETGLYYIRASWSGDSDYVGADSPIISITALSTLSIAFLVITISLICIGTVALIMTKQKYSEMEEEPQVPEVPSLFKRI